MLTAMESALPIGLRPIGAPSPLWVLPPLTVVCGRLGGKGRLFGRGEKMDDRLGTCRNHPLSARVRAGQRDLKTGYHPLEEIEEMVPSGDGEERRLTDAETARTIIEVHSKAHVMFSGFVDEDLHENIIWPDLRYLTDEHGDIYFEVDNEKEILQTMIMDDKLVQVAIGLDNIEMLAEMELSGPSDIDFQVEEVSSDEDDITDDEDVMAILDEVDTLLSSDNTSDWTNLETMQFCHPMDFAKQMEESISKCNLEWMDQPPACIIIQGHLRPAFDEENRSIRKLPYNGASDMDQNLHNGAVFYKLDMINIQIASAYGNQLTIQIQDYRDARPDVLAHSAVNIITRLKAGGEKISQALKLLCIRQKGIHVEEAVVIGIDSLGFDVRVCAGRQVQTLRFVFETQATSEFSAEKQLNDLLFPRIQRKQQSWRQAPQGVDS